MGSVSNPDHCLVSVMKTSKDVLSDDEYRAVYEVLNEGMRGGQIKSDELHQIVGTITHASKIERRNDIMNALKMEGLIKGVQEAGEVHAYKSVKFILEKAETTSKAHVDMVAGGWLKDLEKGGALAVMRDASNELEIRKELARPGSSKDPLIVACANATRKAFENVRTALLRVGSDIADLPDYTGRQNHSIYRIMRGFRGDVDAARKAWIEFTYDKLDVARTFGSIPAEKHGDFMEAAFDAIVNGHHQELSTGADGAKPLALFGKSKGTDYSKQLAALRSLHFKNEELSMAYAERYAEGTYCERIEAQLKNYAAKAGLMQALGTNPKAAADTLIDRAIHPLKQYKGDLGLDTLKGDTARSRLGKVVMELTGDYGDYGGSAAWAEIGAWMRLQQSSSKLGSMAVTIPTDHLSTFLELKHQGLPLSQRIFAPFNTFLKSLPCASTEDKALCASLADTAEMAIGYSMRNFFSTIQKSGISGARRDASHFFFNSTLMPWLTKVTKTSFMYAMQTFHASQAHLPFDSLKPLMQSALKAGGITSEDWDVIRVFGKSEYGGKTFIDPSLVEKANLEVGLRYRTFLCERRDYAVTTPGVVEKAMVNQGTHPGTFTGTLMRAITQFKTFGIAYARRTAHRSWNAGSGWEKQMNRLEFLALTLPVGGLICSLRGMAKGQEPVMPWEAEDPKAVLAEWMLAGGFLGIYGDMVSSAQHLSRYGAGLLATLGGPLASTAEAAFRNYTENKGEDGDPWANHQGKAQAITLLKQNIPMANLFYARLALDYMLFWRWQEDANPGYLYRAEENLKKYQGREYFDFAKPTNLYDE